MRNYQSRYSRRIVVPWTNIHPSQLYVQRRIALDDLASRAVVGTLESSIVPGSLYRPSKIAESQSVLVVAMRRRSRLLIANHIQPRPAHDQNVRGSPPSSLIFVQGEPGARLEGVSMANL